MVPEEQLLLTRINKSELEKIAEEKSSGKLWRVESDYIRGGGCIILILRSCATDETWAARFPTDQDFPMVEESEVEPLEYTLKHFPGIAAPRLHGYAADRANSVGAAYTLVDWIKGQPLEPWNTQHPPKALKRRVIKQLVGFMARMLTTPAEKDANFYGVPKGTPKGTKTTATAWLTESVDRGLRRSLLQGKPDRAIEYLIQRSKIKQHIVEDYDESSWVVVHSDLHNGNIIVDQDFKITGLIDWAFTFAAPLQKAATFPKLLENVPGGAPPGVPESHAYLDLKEEKEYFLRVFGDLEYAQRGDRRITELIRTSSERNFFEMSLHRPAVREQYVKRYCRRTSKNKAAALEQVDCFLSEDEEFNREDQTIINVLRMLKL